MNPSELLYPTMSHGSFPILFSVCISGKHFSFQWCDTKSEITIFFVRSNRDFFALIQKEGVHIFTFIALMKTSYLRSRAYLVGHIINMLGSFIFGYIAVCVWRALLGNSAESDRMATYVMVSQALLWVTMFLPKSAYLYQKVRDGTLVFDLVRPTGIFFIAFSEVSGSALYNFIYRSIPIFILGVILLGTDLPSTSTFSPFLISIIPAFIISFCLNYFVGIWAIRFLNFSAAQNMYYFLANTLSGYFVPAEYFPEFFRPLVSCSPFAGMCYIPSKIYIGEINPLRGISIQLLWVVILVAVSILLTKTIKKSVQIQGG